MDYAKKKLLELVSDNVYLAKALRFLGISFEHYGEHTLEQLCVERNINLQTLTKELEEAAQSNGKHPELIEYPLDILVNYLRHSHHLFIKNRLPYMRELVEEFSPQAFNNKQLGQDLKFVFPLFCEDFIMHIYHEEDTLFKYILEIDKAFKSGKIHTKAELLLKEHRIREFMHHHTEHPSEMQGIRELTNNFSLENEPDVRVKVLFAALQEFEQELNIHANIEDHILMPKAFVIEQELMSQLRAWARNN